MQEYIEKIATEQGWTDATTVLVLGQVLGDLRNHVRGGLIEELIAERTEA